MLGKLRRKHPYAYFILIGAGAIMFWRGLWGLMDLYLFPSNASLSFLASIGFGLLVLFITHAWVNRSY